jgi:transposase, IS5 family
MLGKTEKNPQLNLTEVPLVHFISSDHELCILAKKINWNEVEKDFAVYYSTKGAPSIPIRTMVGLTILKQIFHYGDKTAIEHWLENPYWQHFCGEVYFQNKAPFYYSDFGHFKKRIGKVGEEKIIKLTASLFGKAGEKAFKPVTKKDRKDKNDGLLGIIKKFVKV